MKRLLVFLLICLSSTALFATGEQFEWITEGCEGARTTITGVLTINGEEQFNQNLEVVVFDQNEICRGAKLPKQRNGQWVYQITCCGYDGCIYTLKVWDHETEDFLDLEQDLNADYFPTNMNGVLQWKAGGKIGSLVTYFPINFASPSSGYQLPIVGWENYEGEEEVGGYYLIATPVNGVQPGYVANMVTEEATEYDLYSFMQYNEDGDEWRNFQQQQFETLETGKGYLYARKSSETLVFTGSDIVQGENYEMPLTRNDEADSWAGWNLVGNPFAEDVAYFLEDRDYLVLSEAGDVFVTDEEPGLNPMQGAFVFAEQDGEMLTFTKSQSKQKHARLAINVSNRSNLVDRAVVRFNESRQLPKLMFNSNSSKLYIPMNDNDYTVVSTESMGELPVNFKAAKSGSYNLSFNAQEVSFAYLHLIDNMTGNDVDLLATPSYSFEASTTDYESRFKLVFATGNADEDFAFFSNGNFIINNEGNATLQVVDVTGRILKSETINGCASVNVNAANGVYMLRLINGDNVKVQKVVVK